MPFTCTGLDFLWKVHNLNANDKVARFAQNQLATLYHWSSAEEDANASEFRAAFVRYVGLDGT